MSRSADADPPGGRGPSDASDPPGRNDPCRCGSGRKYKRCCLAADREAASERLKADAVTAKLSDVQSPGFALDAPTPAAADRWLGAEADARPVALDGLSLAGYARLLHYEPTVGGLALVEGRPDPESAAWAEGRVQVATRLAREPEGEAAFLLARLLEALPAGRALGMTRSSLLPRATVRGIARAHATAFPDSLHGPVGPIAVETDFDALHAVRLAAEDAGLLELEDGVLAQTPLGLGLAERSGLRESFPKLLLAYATVLDWDYLDDGLPEAPSVQDAWLVGLRLVARHGSGRAPGSAPDAAFGEASGEGAGIEIGRLARALTVASAEAVHEIHAGTNAPDVDPEDGFDGSVDEAVDFATTAFTWRMLVRFVEFFGLATVTEADGGPRLGPDGEPRFERALVRATAQLGDAVRFDPALLEGPRALLAGALPDELEGLDEAVLAEAAATLGIGIGIEAGETGEPVGSSTGSPVPDPAAGTTAGGEIAAPADTGDATGSGATTSGDGPRRRPAHAADAAARRRRRR